MMYKFEYRGTIYRINLSMVTHVAVYSQLRERDKSTLNHYTKVVFSGDNELRFMFKTREEAEELAEKMYSTPDRTTNTSLYRWWNVY